jgi:uncharacterized protein (DUF362 family)
VSVVRETKNIEQAIRKSIELIGGMRIENVDEVVIKPNLCNTKNPYRMVITDFRIIESLIKILKEKGKKTVIVESDNISATAEYRIEKSGLLDLLKRWDTSFLNLSHDNFEEHTINGETIRVPKTVLEADYFINLPKIKTEGHVGVTLSIKNLFGLIQRKKKSTLHKSLNEVLPYLVKIIRNDLIIMDGLTCMEGNGPIIGSPKELGIIIAGRNCVPVDAFCANLMGYKPYEIEHIVRAHGYVGGEIDLKKIEIVGDEWSNLACEFERPYSLRATIKSMKSFKDIYLTR